MFKLEKYYPKGFNPQQYWDDKYSQEHIAGKSGEEFKRQGFWPLMEKNLPKDKKNLDVGCGIGGWILFLKEQGYDVEGVDIAIRTVRALTEYDPDLKVKVASITSIPYPDNYFGGVLAVGTLEYVEDKVPAALAEVNRVLERGGIFFIEVPVANLLRKLFYIPLKKIERAIRLAKGMEPTFSNYLFDRSELKKMLDEAGFDLLEEQPHELPDTDGHYGLYVDWPFLRGKEPYQLNGLGMAVKKIANRFSPWIASTGTAVVAKKR